MVSDDDEPNEHEDANDFDVDDEEMNDLDEDDYNSDGSMEENVVHSIVDSDSEDSYQEDNQIDHYQRIFDIKKEMDKSAGAFDDGVEIKENDIRPPYQANNNNNNKQNINQNIKSNSRYRQYLKTHLNKEGFTKLLRYQAVKRSVTRYVNVIQFVDTITFYPIAHIQQIIVRYDAIICIRINQLSFVVYACIWDDSIQTNKKNYKTRYAIYVQYVHRCN